jgi:zinc protease
MTIFVILIAISFSAFAKPVLNIQHFTTKNGARVLFMQTNELPMVDIAVTFNAGSARDGNDLGIAQFTNAMLEEGTKTLTADQIASQFDAVGAKFGAAVNRDMAQVQLRTLTDAKFLDPAINTFALVISEPKFARSAFKRVQKQILSAIAQEQQQPLIIAKNTFYKELYGNSPYAHAILGTAESIKSLRPKDLQSFYKKYYVAKNANISIVGDLSLLQAENIVNRITNNLPQGQAAAKLNPAAVTPVKVKHINFPSAQTNILIGQIGIARSDPDYFPLLVGNYILGQSPLTSKLFQEVRNKQGLAYSVGSAFVPLQVPGPFAIILQTRTAKADQAIKISQQTLMKFITQGPTQKLLQAAKQSIIGHFPLELASNGKILAYLNLIGFYNLPLNYLDTYRSKISAVTLKQIQQTFQNHIHPKKLTIITVG